MSTMQWHFSCMCAQRILILSRSIGELALFYSPRLDTQATFAKLFAGIGVDGDICCSN